MTTLWQGSAARKCRAWNLFIWKMRNTSVSKWTLISPSGISALWTSSLLRLGGTHSTDSSLSGILSAKASLMQKSWKKSKKTYVTFPSATTTSTKTCGLACVQKVSPNRPSISMFHLPNKLTTPGLYGNTPKPVTCSLKYSGKKL